MDKHLDFRFEIPKPPAGPLVELFDGNRSVQIVLDALRQHSVPSGSSINFFAKEKRGHRVLL